MRRRNAVDVEPEEAAVWQLQRIVIDADIAGESGGDDIRRLRQIGNRFAVRPAAGAVDSVDGVRP